MMTAIPTMPEFSASARTTNLPAGNWTRERVFIMNTDGVAHFLHDCFPVLRVDGVTGVGEVMHIPVIVVFRRRVDLQIPFGSQIISYQWLRTNRADHNRISRSRARSHQGQHPDDQPSSETIVHHLPGTQRLLLNNPANCLDYGVRVLSVGARQPTISPSGRRTALA